MVTRKSRAEIERMRRAGRVVAEVLDKIEAELRPGVSTAHLDAIAEAHIRAAGATPSFKGYPGINPRRPFPASVCISIDDEIVHGIPGQRTIRAGQIVSVDAGAIVDGWHGDGARTFYVGDPPAAGRRADRPDPRGDDGRHRRRRPGQPHRGHLGRGRGRRRAGRPGRHPPVRRARHRHRDARGAPGPELPDGPSPDASSSPACASPSSRCSPSAATTPGSRPTTGRSSPPTARWRPISSTRSP